MLLLPTSHLVPAANLRTQQDGELLIGGYPTRLLRLTPGGAHTVSQWFAGTPVGPLESHRELARRLVERGMAAPVHPANHRRLHHVTVVIPMKDDVAGLVSTLTGLARSLCPSRPTDAVVSIDRVGPLAVVIVDDGSRIPLQESDVRDIPDLAGALELTFVRLERNVGPGAARNHGLGLVGTECVAFVDAGVTLDAAQLARLASELDDPSTVAVGPRVAAKVSTVTGNRASGLIADYETRWSPLDLGDESGVVGPDRRTTYLPSTCLVAKTADVRDIGAFDVALRYGEDVDLVWRLAKRGWVRYVADVVVGHPPRPTMAGLVHQRFRYGSAAGPLALRHPRNLAPVSLTPSMATVWIGLLTRRPLGVVLALAAGARNLMRLSSSVGRVVHNKDEQRRVTGMLAAEGFVGTGLGLGNALTRTWLPGLIVLALLSRGRLLKGPVLLAALTGALRRVSRAAPEAAITDVTVGLIDDLAYSSGVWHGARQNRTLKPLLPRRSRTATER